MISLSSRAKAAGIQTAIGILVGERPSVEEREGYLLITFPPSVQARIAAMASEPPGEVRVEWAPLLKPFLFKKAIPVALMLAAGFYLLGRLR